MGPLPKFREHGADIKFKLLDQQQIDSPTEHNQQFIEMVELFAGKSLSGLKILDFGCGRGELTGGLRRKGAEAYGVELSQESINCGKMLEEGRTSEFPVLSLLDENGRSLFPDGYFDLVVSDQVLEHVSDPMVVFSEMHRVLKPGGLTINQFPAKWRPIEPHYNMPVVHWLPKGRTRSKAIGMLLRLGVAKRFFPSYSLPERTEIIGTYADEETFYRQYSSIRSLFTSAGFSDLSLQGMRAILKAKKPASHQYLQLIIPLITSFQTCVIAGRAEPAGAPRQL